MILCPECGQRVSTMAGTCPHCGVKIANNLRLCPECGAYCLNEQNECPQCHASLSVEITLQLEEAQTAPEPEKPVEPKPVKRKSRMPHVAPLIVGCIIAIIISIYYYDIQKVKDKEASDFARLEKVTNPEFYQQFLIDYPDSEHYTEVEERMHKLLDETDDWQKVMKNCTKEELTHFMQAHPYTNRMRICEDMIDSIEWNEALSQKTDEAIDTYLQNHPEGRYAGEAAEKKNEIAKMKITDEEKNMIRGRLETFFTAGLSKQDQEQIAALIPEKMTSFCGTEDATPEQIVDFAKKKMEKDVIGLHYLIGTDLSIRKVTLPDSSLGYAVNFTLEETINRSDTNQPASKSYKVSATLTAEQKLLKMSIQ